MAEDPSNSLLSSHKSSDSGLQIHLHPLVLLTISDYITRHILRRQLGPIVGVLLGQQNGREISLEYAFECSVIPGGDETVIINDEWLRARLKQYKDVHKVPALELVGWFTTAPPSGPESQQLPIHQQILRDYNETAVLLAFHPSGVSRGAAVGGKLPLTVYESVYESGKAEAKAGGGGAMEIEDQQATQGSQLDLRFRELPYSVETGEAEMISVDFVARSGGTATAAEGATKNGKGQAPQAPVVEIDLRKGLGKQKEVKVVEDSSVLSAEDEELIATLMARANAIKMLHTRIRLLKSYLSNLPPSYLNASVSPDTSTSAPSSNHTEINHPILRSIQALISRLPLLLPADQVALEQERLAEKSDVSLVDLLGNISKSIKDTREMGRKFGIIEQARQTAKRGATSTFTDDFFPGASTVGGEKTEGAAYGLTEVYMD
ncbi:hypothetical protein MMC29_002453 [Sticta canariensis]|nr:hypothetical protein [Sticta canariensis]